MRQFLGDWQTWLSSCGILVGIVILALIGYYAIFSALKRVALRTGSALDDSLLRHGQKPARVLFPLLAVFFALPVLHLPRDLMELIRHVIGLSLIASTAWLIIGLTEVFDDLVFAKYKIDIRENLAARKVRTQIEVLQRIAVVIVIFVTISLMLMTFPSIRHLGTSLLASAGLAGLVVGIAARSTLSNLMAGMQIALTQPIRLEDEVVVEGEYGWIEEINTTYVVVRIWDLRRLVVPLSYFIEKPFQSWTRKAPDILGTVFLYVDYSVPVEEVRHEFYRILETSGMWDGKVWGLQVTNATEHTIELRALISSSDSGKAWELRCYVREKLIEFLQKRYPQSLPMTRFEIRSVREEI